MRSLLTRAFGLLLSCLLLLASSVVPSYGAGHRTSLPADRSLFVLGPPPALKLEAVFLGGGEPVAFVCINSIDVFVIESKPDLRAHYRYLSNWHGTQAERMRKAFAANYIKPTSNLITEQPDMVQQAAA